MLGMVIIQIKCMLYNAKDEVLNPRRKNNHGDAGNRRKLKI
jgi:hypothetical protein